MLNFKFDPSLAILKLGLGAAYRSLERILLVLIFIVSPAATIFIFPGGLAWLGFLCTQDKATIERVKTDVWHNTLWYNFYISLPIICLNIGLLLIIKLCKFLIISPKTEELFDDVCYEEGTFIARKQRFFNDPSNYDITSYLSSENYIQISNKLCASPKFYSKQLLSSQGVFQPYASEFYERFESTLFRCVGFLLAKTNEDITVIFLQMLSSSTIVNLMVHGAYYPNSAVYWKNHVRKFAPFTPRPQHDAVPLQNAKAIIKAYTLHRGTKVILDPMVIAQSKSQPSGINDQADIENQLFGLSSVIPELQQSNLCRPLLSNV